MNRKNECNNFVCHLHNKDLGIEDDDCWMPFAFDLTEVVAIKECGKNDFLGTGKATIWLRSGQEITINMSYADVLKTWIDSRKQ